MSDESNRSTDQSATTVPGEEAAAAAATPSPSSTVPNKGEAFSLATFAR